MSAAVSGASLLAATLGPYDGLFQRIGLTVGDAWIAASAARLARGAGPYT